MDALSPPKRMTRARAAATMSAPAAKPTRVVTAAAKATAARSTSATTTSTTTALKRKSPFDEDELEMQPAKKVAGAAAAKSIRGRGRPRKVTVEDSVPSPAPAQEPAPEPTPAATVRARGRPKKTADIPAEKPAAKTARATRTKKTLAEAPEAAADSNPKGTRRRPAISSSTTAAAKPVVKKTVKFEEPEKENLVPATGPAKKTSVKAPAPAPTTGLRGKPIRKAGSTAAPRAARSARATTGTADPGDKAEKPLPLSPKKVNQLTMNPAESDDELGMEEKVPVRRFKKAPIKPATAGAKPKSAVKPVVNLAMTNDENATATGQAETEISRILATPAKRLPASPWKGSIRSPAKRVEGLLAASVTQPDGQTSQLPTKMGLLQSPAKRQPLNLNPLGTESLGGTASSPVKLSFLSSPAKRPPVSPIKSMPRHIEEEKEEEPENRTPAPKPTLLASPWPLQASSNLEDSPDIAAKSALDADSEDEAAPDSPSRLSFPGRLSAVLPRHADPALTPPTAAVSELTSLLAPRGDIFEEATEEEADEIEIAGEPMVLDEEVPAELPTVASASTTPPSSPPKAANPMFGLREKDLYPGDYVADSDSEDDSPVKHDRFTSAFSALPATPCPAPARNARLMQSASRSTAKRTPAEERFGLTPLAQQLRGWTAGPSPLKAVTQSASPTVGDQEQAALPEQVAALTPPAPAQNTFFEDEMHIRPDAMEADEEDAVTEIGDGEEPVLEDLSFTEVDIELAAEANEMSLTEKDEEVSPAGHSHDDSVSEPSQEYADENAIPIDPTLVAGPSPQAVAVPPVTPQRVVNREFHTVAKVPLKPADDSTPLPKSGKRSFSASKVPATRPSERVTRSATKGRDTNLFKAKPEEPTEMETPATSRGTDLWSTMGTPARTPRRDLNPNLLRGAVVFVDVHTSEGANASGIFVELLTQMGARCVKTWAWNPNSAEPGADSRVGITHVVYKDGGKRTMEKVRGSGGVVQCVGVSWVLDCERENQWLDEVPYYIDTSLVPRGGARRRKSMEPRAISNMNGMLVPSPVRNNNGRGSQTPSTPANNRRASSLWVWSPTKSGDADDDEDGNHDGENNEDDTEVEWSALTPVPKTPAPEAIARFAANISPGFTSPSSVGSVDSEEPLNLDDDDDGHGDAHNHQEKLLRTCPPKRTAFVEPGEGILGTKEKDRGVMMRLMAARRKSLQFAPKVGSPLAKTWKAWN
ncbi:hypothetical protein C8A05DRAFT_13407 [Staphylotrichum tortipilum]|uniref:BRCT domain-containing protein n=1 Tax=Staphylotrichum tortipilum TaxID=2831512 RepID=A0AAN6RVX4_9PEZI|nr:hypothetical protein C8A05DRAFT_13407 [Staphylotrichum longicolle]